MGKTNTKHGSINHSVKQTPLTNLLFGTLNVAGLIGRLVIVVGGGLTIGSFEGDCDGVWLGIIVGGGED